jgi:hypothetical protein
MAAVGCSACQSDAVVAIPEGANYWLDVNQNNLGGDI